MAIVEANVDTAVFNTWVEKILIPDLPDNSIVIMDNAAFHKSQKTRELIENNGHKIEFLPPYSPDLILLNVNGLNPKPLGLNMIVMFLSFFYLMFHNSFIPIWLYTNTAHTQRDNFQKAKSIWD